MAKDLDHQPAYANRLKPSSIHLEYLFILCCVLQCMLNLLNDYSEEENKLSHYTYFQRILIYSPIFSVFILMYMQRGIRVHLMPASTGFLSYTYANTFLLFEETTFYYYVLTTGISFVLFVFFGRHTYFESCNDDTNLQIGCKICYLP